MGGVRVGYAPSYPVKNLNVNRYISHTILESLRFLIIFAPPLQFSAENFRKVPDFFLYLSSPSVLRAVRKDITPILSKAPCMSQFFFDTKSKIIIVSRTFAEPPLPPHTHAKNYKYNCQSPRFPHPLKCSILWKEKWFACAAIRSQDHIVV